MYKFISLVLITTIFGCKEKKVDTKAEGEKLMALSREWSKSAATNDFDKIVSYWADDALMMSAGHPTLKGKKAIREMVEGSSKIPGFKISWEPLSVSVSKSGDMAWMLEKNQVTMNDSTGKPITTFGTGVTIWRKEDDGNWKNVVEVMQDDEVK